MKNKTILLIILSLFLLASQARAESVSVGLLLDKASYLSPALSFDLVLNEAYPAKAIALRLEFDPQKLNLDQSFLDPEFCEIIVYEQTDNEQGVYQLMCGRGSEAADISRLLGLKFIKKTLGQTEITISEAWIPDQGDPTANIVASTEIHRIELR